MMTLVVAVLTGLCHQLETVRLLPPTTNLDELHTDLERLLCLLRDAEREQVEDIRVGRRLLYDAEDLLMRVSKLKPRSLREEPFDPSAIAEEMFSHNHQECIKSQMGAMDAHQFFKKVGLDDDSDDDFTIASELPAISKMKYEIANARMEFEEVPEHVPEMGSLFAQPGSPEHCKTPKLSSGCSMWDDFAVNFKLLESP